MKPEHKRIQIGAAVIVCAIILRLCATGVVNQAVGFLTQPGVLSAILFLETGRVVRPPAEETKPPQPSQPAPTQSVVIQENAAVFAPEDADCVEVNSVCGYDADVEALLQKPLTWQLRQDAPTVLILHTHGTESYTKTENYTESSAYRTLNTDYNVVSVGEELKKLLEAGGVQVIHDTTLHDHPSYSNSYNLARTAIREYLEEYPSICLVLDIHRDSVQSSSGEEMRFVTEVDGQAVAQLMMVVGTNASGLNHPNWPENMSLAVKLHAQLEKSNPGICRSISFRKQRFNQDLCSGGLIIEVGSAGNTRQEALLGAQKLAEAILALSAGAQVQ